MPYDPRPVSEGGNRGIDEEFTRKAQGKYRVVGVDTFDGTDWVQGDYPSRNAAIEVAQRESGTMCKMYVYDDQGRCRHAFGTF